jgi:hypothetical protein
MCTVLLPPGINPVAVKYLIYHIISYSLPPFILHFHEKLTCNSQYYETINRPKITPLPPSRMTLTASSTRRFQKAEDLRFQDSRHMKVGRLSALCTFKPPPPPRKDSWYSFLLEAESTSMPQYSRKNCQRNVLPNRLEYCLMLYL